MKKFFFEILATLAAAAIVANVAALFRLNEKVARIETKIEMLGQTKIAKKHE